MSASKTILIVEDELEIRELIFIHLGRNQYKVLTSGSSEEAFEVLKSNKVDLIILDWMLPGMSGIDFIKSLKNQSLNIPTLMLSAKVDVSNIVQGLETGADDYLTKPFDPQVLLARVKVLLRRSESQEGQVDANHSSQIQFGDLFIDIQTYEVKVAGEKLHLTPSEFKLLYILVSNKGKVLSRESLIDQIQGEGISVIGRTIDTHVFGLRKKIGACSEYIETIRGIGYKVSLPK